MSISGFYVYLYTLTYVCKSICTFIQASKYTTFIYTHKQNLNASERILVPCRTGRFKDMTG